jgi:hypothetical protein
MLDAVDSQRKPVFLSESASNLTTDCLDNQHRPLEGWRTHAVHCGLAVHNALHAASEGALPGP